MKNVVHHFRLLTSILLFSAFLLTSCTKEGGTDPEDKLYDPSIAYDLTDIAYGDHAQQKMDIYLPANRDDKTTKVFVLIHGGGWSEGDKADFTETLKQLKTIFPDKAVININYQLGNASSPGYPKQINDIRAALEHIQLSRYDLSDEYFLIGGSAGAHLSMLYAYAFDTKKQVQGVCNIVGPSDLTDPAYVENLLFFPVFAPLLGNETYAGNPGLFAEASPAKRVTSSSPPTISFYGGLDILIPLSQKTRLDEALANHNVTNESTLYPLESHTGWSEVSLADMISKLYLFIQTHFE